MDTLFGKYRGLVTNVNDPENMGRIKVKCPKVIGEYESDWCLPSAPFSSANAGLIMLPNEGDMVWIEFEEGDPEKPIYSGFFWSNGECPSNSNKKRTLVDNFGNSITFTETGAEVLDVNGNKIVLSATGSVLSDCNGNNITLSASGIKLNSVGECAIVCTVLKVD